jgi:hypothetical protein
MRPIVRGRRIPSAITLLILGTVLAGSFARSAERIKFGEPISLSEPFRPMPCPAGIAVGDLNKDGHVDLVLGKPDTYSFSVLFGIGDGDFQPPIFYSTSGPILDVNIADVNKDGNPDILAVGQWGPALLMTGQGDGTFETNSLPLPGDINILTSIQAADFDNDSNIDIAVFNWAAGQGSASFFGNTLILITNDSNGEFFASDLRLNYTSESEFAIARITDLNKDGKLDVVTHCFTKTVQAFLGNGDGSFAPSLNFTNSSGQFCLGMEIADMNRDGIPDVVAITADLSEDFDAPAIAGVVELWLGHTNGTFSLPILQPCANGPSAMAIADMNGDSVPDVVIGTDQGITQILLNNGEGMLSVSGEIFGTTFLHTFVGKIAAADFNKDGKPDLFLGGTKFSPGIVRSTNTQFSIYLNQGTFPLLETRISGTSITLSWPTNFPGWKLQFSTNLDSTNWVDCPETPAIDNRSYNVSNGISGLTKFYRLKN